MQSLTLPTSNYKGCSIHGLPIATPFRVQYETEGKENQIGIFIILPYQITNPGTLTCDFTRKHHNTQVHSSPLNPQAVLREGYNEYGNAHGIQNQYDQSTKKTLNAKAALQEYMRLKGISKASHTSFCIQPATVPYVEQGTAGTVVVPFFKGSLIPTNQIQNISYISANSTDDNFIPCEIKTADNDPSSQEQNLTEKTTDGVKNHLNEIPGTDTEMLDVDSKIGIKTEPEDSVFNIVNNFDNTKTAQSMIITDEGKERNSVSLMSFISDRINSSKKTNKFQKTSKKKKKERNLDRAEGIEHNLLVKKSKRQATEENTKLSEMLELRHVKVDEKEGEMSEVCRRKSSRIRSVGFRPDYQFVENKFDEVIHYLEDDVSPNDITEDENFEDVEEVKVENVGIEESSFIESENHALKNTRHEELCIGGENTKSAKKPKKAVRGCTDPDYDPTKQSKKEKKKNKISDKIRMKNSDVNSSSENEDQSSDCETDGNDTVAPKKIPKKVQKKEYIHVKLEDHQDKYKMEMYGSIARKDRGKTETERSVEVYVCILCKKFKTEGVEGIVSHLEKHLNGKLDCKQCDFSASNYKDLFLHKKEEHMEENGRICPQCGLKMSGFRLKDHIGTVHNNPQHECAFCLKNGGINTKYFTYRELRNHFEDSHRDLGEICKNCDKVFFNKNNFKSHDKYCAGKKVDFHCCKKCGAKYKYKQSLKVHIDVVHLRIRKYQCPECPYTALKRPCLTRHQLVHKGVHPHNCPECDFTCVQPYQLTSHMRTHTGDKPYKCTQCKYAAAWNVQLKEHARVHSMESAVTCNHCDILFKNEKTLNMHKKKKQCTG